MGLKKNISRDIRKHCNKFLIGVLHSVLFCLILIVGYWVLPISPRIPDLSSRRSMFCRKHYPLGSTLKGKNWPLGSTLKGQN